MDETQQVGVYQGAAMWRGTPKSYLSLHPAGASGSGAVAVYGGMQVGSVWYPSSDYRAAMWRGTAESFVDLHPPGALRSHATATDGVLQGGSVIWPGTPFSSERATIWYGTAESFVDLAPGEETTSRVHGMAPGVQVGEAQFPGSVRAALWRGTRESYEDFAPAGVSISMFYATTGKIHVGRMSQGGSARAAINFGTPGSWMSLQQFLPPQYGGFSSATSVYQDGPVIYVGGWARQGVDRAILWIGPAPCYVNCDGSTITPALNVNDFVCFQQRFAAGCP